MTHKLRQLRNRVSRRAFAFFACVSPERPRASQAFFELPPFSSPLTVLLRFLGHKHLLGILRRILLRRRDPLRFGRGEVLLTLPVIERATCIVPIRPCAYRGFASSFFLRLCAFSLPQLTVASRLCEQLPFPQPCAPRRIGLTSAGAPNAGWLCTH